MHLGMMGLDVVGDMVMGLDIVRERVSRLVVIAGVGQLSQS